MPGDYKKKTIELHEKLRGKIEIRSKKNVDTIEDLTLLYTPGVAEPCKKIVENREFLWGYTIKHNSVAVVTDGSAVLGLGNIGAEASLPVMEGKCLLFKELAGIDAFPIALKTQNADEIVKIIENISPVFGGINLEDISAPRCFEIEEKLQNIGIPVFHDDQHGTAITVLAALLNTCKVVGKQLSELKVVIVGAGAAGISIAKVLTCGGFDRQICTPAKEVILVDVNGILYKGRENLHAYHNKILPLTNPRNLKGGLEEAVKDADVLIGVSVGGVVSKEMVKNMDKNAIVFAMANPVPEIMPKDAFDTGAKIVATGRSDLPNQINNALAFPGVFRGALNARAERITGRMKLAASHALADTVKNPDEENIMPKLFDRNVVDAIAKAVEKEASR